MNVPEVQLGQITDGVEVRIRTDLDTSEEAVVLCQASIADLEQIMLWVKMWGVAVDGNTYVGASGQFAITSRGAFFEIIVDTGDPE